MERCLSSLAIVFVKEEDRNGVAILDANREIRHLLHGEGRTKVSSSYVYSLALKLRLTLRAMSAR